MGSQHDQSLTPGQGLLHQLLSFHPANGGQGLFGRPSPGHGHFQRRLTGLAHAVPGQLVTLGLAQFRPALGQINLGHTGGTPPQTPGQRAEPSTDTLLIAQRKKGEETNQKNDNFGLQNNNSSQVKGSYFNRSRTG